MDSSEKCLWVSSFILLWMTNNYHLAVIVGQLFFDIETMDATTAPSPPPRPPCGLTRQEVERYHVQGMCPVAGGRCQNPYDDEAGVEHKCGKAMGAHPSETEMTGNYLSHPVYFSNFFNFLCYFCRIPPLLFNDTNAIFSILCLLSDSFSQSDRRSTW